MKKILILGVALLAFIGCKDGKNNEKSTVDTTDVKATELAYASFGEKIEADKALSITEINNIYDGLKTGDTLDVKFAAKINSVCANKGCWMRLDAGDEKEVMVKFKDYGFFMPLDAKGEVVVNGKAFVQETSVDELKHYAEDAGKSEEEIAKITEPKKTLSFIADGVLLKN
ncbi:DUF4920 domain-containing protein [Kordia sp. YSTF-M3]|uniref:DUF4920 domain-containing protein n=1 Tax=Kordia aestuariivivens TaxID=2759037 RepID=A0ABR7QDL1_9FLAO|nr:DUF4920 domain-containing protein [Kordia aestuariivivens]MBC8756639.1 DUF4920 domain-containing protein [Kordia aestuariivivens]